MDRSGDRTVHTRVQNVRAVLRGAVRDRVIATAPATECHSAAGAASAP